MSSPILSEIECFLVTGGEKERRKNGVFPCELTDSYVEQIASSYNAFYALSNIKLKLDYNHYFSIVRKVAILSLREYIL